MDWLTEYLDLLVPVFVVLMYLLQRMFVRGEEEGEARGPELDEEARRIQEEIRRKIVARQRGEDLPPPPVFERAENPPSPFVREPEVAPPPIQERFPRADWRQMPEPPPVAVEPEPSLLDELRVQRERLREAREAKEAAVNRTKTAGGRARRRAVEARVSVDGNLREQLQADLANGDGLKRAFLLKEVLDRPVGLRERPDSFGNW